MKPARSTDRLSRSEAATWSPSVRSNPPTANSSRRCDQSGLACSGDGRTRQPSARISLSLAWRRPFFHDVFRCSDFPVRLSWLMT